MRYDPGFDTGDMMKLWRRDGFSLRLYYLGSEKIGYVFRDGGKVVFSGCDYRPSPLHSCDSLDSVYGLLGFLSMQDGDTDAEYFADYTPAQLAWRDSGRAEELSMYVYDHEERRS